MQKLQTVLSSFLDDSRQMFHTRLFTVQRKSTILAVYQNNSVVAIRYHLLYRLQSNDTTFKFGGAETLNVKLLSKNPTQE